MIQRTFAMLALMLALAPITSSAGPYRCKASDGRVSYQDQPCQEGSTGGEITLKVAPPDPEAIKSAKRASTREAAPGQQARNEARAKSEEVDALKRAVLCGSAQRGLGVLKEQRPVFRYDNQGERQYIDDASRQSEIAAARNSIAANCN